MILRRATLSRSAVNEGLDERFGVLAKRLQTNAHRSAGAPFAVGLTSTRRGEGVSTTAVNLAIAEAREHGMTLLIDANFRHPSVARLLNMPERPGLAEALLGKEELGDCVHQTTEAGLSIMPAGNGKSLRRSLIAADNLAAQIDALKRRFSTILVDLPPADDLSDAVTLASALDGVLLVVEAERVRTENARRTTQRLIEAQATLLGVVFNKRPLHAPSWLT